MVWLSEFYPDNGFMRLFAGLWPGGGAAGAKGQKEAAAGRYIARLRAAACANGAAIAAKPEPPAGGGRQRDSGSRKSGNQPFPVCLPERAARRRAAKAGDTSNLAGPCGFWQKRPPALMAGALPARQNGGFAAAGGPANPATKRRQGSGARPCAPAKSRKPRRYMWRQ